MIEFLAAVDHARALSTGVLVLGLFLLRYVLRAQVIRVGGLKEKERRQWLIRIRTGILFALLAGLVLIWAEQIREFSLTLMAFAVAMVIALKELIVCLTGSVMRLTSQSFSVGDRIEVKGIRGYVIDQSLLATTLAEIGPGSSSQIQTGRSISLPNSIFLSESVTNESFLDEHVFHVFTVPLRIDGDWRRRRDSLVSVADEVCRPYTAAMGRQIECLAKEHGIALPDVCVRVALRIPEPDRLDLIVRVPAPADRRGRVEQTILDRFLQGEVDLGSAAGSTPFSGVRGTGGLSAPRPEQQDPRR
jgi:small-conductance mechanosensitive channel